ncbi:hypothetical protein FY528_06925 [Hymenobacter lutimineralis]|uniref:Uncharacterized protein n=1 Tax=Hymenobacter lutimineralis TaxID=2606448 RepID=A0A5D6V5Z4_9BACT|nr:hypothetical protein [Hymenobacter lutimineralis]TYZ11421.1 hypothetical protein FY528_06925 [Hymenobacter lutimineralis]
MKKTFEDESDALSTSPSTPTTAQNAATSPTAENAPPVPTAGNGAPDYSQVHLNTDPGLPAPDGPGGSATAPESGGGYSG